MVACSGSVVIALCFKEVVLFGKQFAKRIFKLLVGSFGNYFGRRILGIGRFRFIAQHKCLEVEERCEMKEPIQEVVAAQLPGTLQSGTEGNGNGNEFNQCGRIIAFCHNLERFVRDEPFGYL